jgi:hypothetical protein
MIQVRQRTSPAAGEAARNVMTRSQHPPRIAFAARLQCVSNTFFTHD